MNNKRHIVVGSRGSKLALLQTELVVQKLRESYPSIEFTVKKIRTSGDRDAKTALTQISGQGVFVKELEEALLAAEIDLAVHSLKDVPTELDPELRLGAVGMRQEVRDAFISGDGRPLSQLPEGACIGTGSPRRAVQLRAIRPDLQIASLRGNIDTRLNKLYSGQYEGIFVAAAAMLRLGWEDRITEYLSTELFLPAVGQGAIVVELRRRDSEMGALLSAVNDEPTWEAVSAERAFLHALGGGCRAPIAALGVVEDSVLHLEGMAASADGSKIVRAGDKGSPSAPEILGKNLAQRLLSMGVREFIGR